MNRGRGRAAFPGGLICACIAVLSAVAPYAGQAGEAGESVYTNPVIHADYSDPDALRTDDGFYLVSSSFSQVPGLPVLYSRDLVNWRIVNHAVPRLPPGDHFDRPRHGNGIWAPAFRQHGGRFYIYYGDPDYGIYVVTADDPRGEWSEPHRVIPGKGLIDPAPFWDDDGTAWLVHAWAKSRAGFNNVLTLHRMSPDGLSVLDEGTVIIDGNEIEGWNTIEGPKLYKRGGFYYVFAPAGGVRDGWQGVFRARDILGPYEYRNVLAQGDTPVNGPHQGALVSAASGEDWFLHFQDKDAYGRIVHLQPVRWKDGWPVMGSDPDGDGKGEPVLQHAAPYPLEGQPSVRPQDSDEFDSGFNLAWQWQANPDDAWIARPGPEGWLRLNAAEMPANFYGAGNLLMQKFPAESFTVEVRLRSHPAAEGDTAGLVVFGMDYAWLGLVRDGNRLRLQQRIRKDANEDGGEIVAFSRSVNNPEAVLRLEVTSGAVCRFSYREKSGDFVAVGEPFIARQGRWVGARAGVFSGRLPGGAESDKAGYADFDWWRVTAH